MASFLQVLIDALEFLWPFRQVMEWERGVRYTLGRSGAVLPPGTYPVIPWFIEVKTVDAAVDVIGTEEQTIDLTDGSTLTFTASAKLRVVRPDAALNRVVDYEDNVAEDIAAVLADTLADMPVDRLDPDRRRRLLATCVLATNKETEEYGMEVISIRFTDFIREVNVVRLIGGLTA